MPCNELAENAVREENEHEHTESPPDRRGLLIAGVTLLACFGLVGYGILNTDEQPKPRAVPTAEVTYEVTGTGTAEISYLARSEAGAATVEKGVTLPWRKSVQVPLGKAPTVAIVLDGKGGQASCALAIRNKHVQRATAMGEFGRATCTGELPPSDSER
jgi:bifunctional ADP-heptose synthase (sugar kinase/adenylyltransferase)